MNVETIQIDQLSADPANVRTHSEQQIQKLMASLRRWGQTLPLLADQNNVVRVGNARLDAMLRLGWTHVKVVRLDLPPCEWAALAIADNKLHDDSQFDQAALADVLAALRAEDAELAEVAGFSPDELAALLGSDPTPAQAAVQPPAEFKTFDESIPTNCKCPRCAFEWSDGKK
jgi:ParB-like chromosome segregation protein Spo0J